MSSISVVCDGKEQTLEEALDYVMIEIQRRLNNLHMEMRRLACLTEQEIDDFKESVFFRDTSVDYVTGLVRLLEEIPPMASDLVGKSEPSLNLDHDVVEGFFVLLPITHHTDT